MKLSRTKSVLTAIFTAALVVSITLTSMLPTMVLSAPAKTSISVYANGKKMSTTKAQSATKKGNTFVAPAKSFAKLISAKYSFSAKKKLVTLKKGKKRVTLKINSKKGKLGSKNFTLKVKTVLYKKMPRLDVVTVAAKFGYKYKRYYSDTKRLNLSTTPFTTEGTPAASFEPNATNSASPTPAASTPVPVFSIDPNAGANTYRKTGLPIVFINTDNGTSPTKRDLYQTAKICIEQTGEGGNKLLANTPITIAVRGNSTSSANKKPYKFRFIDKEDGKENKLEVLGMKAHHKWNLLANAYDKSLLRNAVALNFASQLSGLDFTTDFRFVDVVLNGKYVGNYMLTERVEISPQRVNIQKKNEAKDRFGYIVEWDQRSAQKWADKTLGVDYFNCLVDGKTTVPFAYKDPDSEELAADGDAIRKEYIAKDVSTTWAKLTVASNSNTEFLDYVDVDSFIDYYFVQEVCMPVDGYNFSSIYMYKDALEGSKMHMGPAWDYDLAFGNTNANDISNVFYRWSPYCSLLRNNSTTYQQYKDRWTQIRPIVLSMVDYLDATAAQIRASAELNYQTWSFTTDQYDNTPLFSTYDEAVSSFKTLLQTRIEAIDNTFNSWW